MKNNKGFTLLEVIISLVLVSVVVLMAITAIDLVRRGETKATERQQLLQIERSLYKNIVMPLRNIYPFYKRDEKGRFVLRFSGGHDSLAFVTTYTEPWREGLIQKPGLKWERLTMDGDELKVMENLFFAEKPEEGAVERVLYKGVVELRFEYLDAEEDIWVDEWPEEKNILPSAIKVHLSFIYKDKRLSFPPIIVHIRAYKPAYGG